MGGRMPSGKTGSGAGSDGVGETHTTRSAGPLSSSVSSPKRGASAAACLGVRGELEELVCLWRALRRGTLGGRATEPPAWRALGDGALLLALSESAWLGERGGVARGAGLRDLWPGWLPAEPGRCGRLPSASGCGLSRSVLASLWRGEALWRGAVLAGVSGCRGGRSFAADAAESRAARSAAALFGGGVVWRGRVVGSWMAWSLGCQRGRPRLGVLARRVWAALVWCAEYCCQARGDAARRSAWLGVHPPLWYPGTAGRGCRGREWPLLEAGAPIGAG